MLKTLLKAKREHGFKITTSFRRTYDKNWAVVDDRFTVVSYNLFEFRLFDVIDNKTARRASFNTPQQAMDYLVFALKKNNI